MSPLGRQIMATKRARADAATRGQRNRVWGLTIVINALVRSRRGM
jgi:hypothetical protein